MNKKIIVFILFPFIVILLFALFVFIAFSRPSPVYLGNNIKCNSIPDARITCKKAYELASPYLEKSFTLKNREFKGEPSDYISQYKKFYYINRDYPLGKSDWFYAGGDSAVKVNKNTGAVIEPK